jgi:site-specific DNA recombinase
MIAIYARQSVDKKDSVSIEVQIEFCKSQFPFHEKFKVYKDKGYSGSNTNRPAFEKMIDDVKSGKINKVVVYRLDRISRSLLDFANIIELFNEHNVEFISSTEKFDTSTPIGRAMLNIVMVFAQLERETIQLRIKDNYYSRSKKGMYMGGQIPFGFIKVPYPEGGPKASTFAPDPENVDTLKEIFELYSTKYTTGEISRYLNDKGIKTASGGLWASSKVVRILRNPCYVKADADIYAYFKNLGAIIDNNIEDFTGLNGCFYYGEHEMKKYAKENVKNTHLCVSVHKGLIDSRTWLECQFKLDNSQGIKNNGKGKTTWLTGLTKCSNCNYAMVPRKTGRSPEHLYYYCKGKYDYKICDTTATWNVRTLEKYIENAILERIRNLKEIYFEEEKVDSSISNEIKLKIVAIDEKIEKLINQLEEASNITTKYINERIAKLDAEKTELSNKLNSELSNKVKDKKIMDLINSFTSWSELDFDDKKLYVKTLIKKIYLGDNDVNIDWNF